MHLSVEEFAVSDLLKPIVNLGDLTDMAIEYLFRIPAYVLNSTGVVFAGYGAAEIFPSFKSVICYGHIGSEICYTDHEHYQTDHTNGAWIQPFAKSSMMQRFTDGFDFKQKAALDGISKNYLTKLVAELVVGGCAIDEAISAPLIAKLQKEVVDEWQNYNWRENFHPLRRVLASLSVQEMAELAETLLVLESLRERVTSPSETVGGPVDVAAITKAEGLVWIRRKHFFEPSLNIRYMDRSKRAL